MGWSTKRALHFSVGCQAPAPPVVAAAFVVLAVPVRLPEPLAQHRAADLPFLVFASVRGVVVIDVEHPAQLMIVAIQFPSGDGCAEHQGPTVEYGTHIHPGAIGMLAVGGAAVSGVVAPPGVGARRPGHRDRVGQVERLEYRGPVSGWMAYQPSCGTKGSGTSAAILACIHRASTARSRGSGVSQPI